jgi:hypothetical protein
MIQRIVIALIMIAAMMMGLALCQYRDREYWDLIDAEYVTIKIETNNTGCSVTSYTTKRYIFVPREKDNDIR